MSTSEKTYTNIRVINKHDIEANWLKAVNFTPKKGEIIIYDADENYEYQRMKIGDGTTLVSDLPFFIEPMTIAEIDAICGITISLAEEGEY